MNIKLYEILIKDLAENYKDAGEKGVTGYNGRLNIRPAFQREFVYKEKQRNAVIETVKKGFPLNVMYWVKNSDDNFEVLDGQQRTISICEFVTGNFSIEFEANNTQYFDNLTISEKEQILNYKLMVYFCEGNDKEKLDWFKIINIAGEKLTDQELRNAVYTGAWLSDAKLKFSKTNCAAYLLAKDYLNGSPIRQDFLESAVSWVSNGEIEEYMAEHQNDADANELWLYFQNVIEWARAIFANYRREMKGVNWGKLYNQYGKAKLFANDLEKVIEDLMRDEDVTRKSGIYEYVLAKFANGDTAAKKAERSLSIRAFTDKMKREAYEKQQGICPICGEHFVIEEMEADHITPWSAGGATVAENCQMLCRECNRRKSDK